MSFITHQSSISFEIIFDAIKEAVKKNASTLTTEFSKCDTDALRFKYFWENQIIQNTLNSFLIENNNYKKNEAEAIRHRDIGTSAYRAKRFSEAMRWYCAAIRLALPQTEELSRSYGNRSAVFFEMGRFDESIKDCHRAIEACTLDNDRIQRYRKRIEKCHQKLYQLRVSPPTCERSLIDFLRASEQPSMEHKNPIFPSLCAKCSVETSVDHGRRVVANEDVKVGETILIEKAFAYALTWDHLKDCCEFCLYPLTYSCIPCDTCVFAAYCNENCKRQALCHKFECDIISFLVNCVSHMEFLALRTIVSSIVYGQTTSNFTQYMWHDYKNILNLIANTSKRSIGDLFKRSIMSIYLVKCLMKKDGFVQRFSPIEIGGQLLLLLQNLPCNAHEIFRCRYKSRKDVLNCQTEEVASGIYATLSMFNHSCDPSVTRNFIQDNCILRAIKPIKAGEEVFDSYSYIYPVFALKERKAALRSQYFFDCDCICCQENWPLYSNLSAASIVLDRKRASLHDEDMNKKVAAFSEVRITLETIMNALINDSACANINGYIRNLCDCIEFMDNNVYKPCIEYCKAQECLKQFFNLMHNTCIILDECDSFENQDRQ